MSDWSPQSHLGTSDRMAHKEEPLLGKHARALTRKANPMTDATRSEASIPAPGQVSSDKLLGELLATIHRDGGQYRIQHGDEKATQDAIQIVAALQASQTPSVGEDAVERVARLLCFLEYGSTILWADLEKADQDQFRDNALQVIQAARMPAPVAEVPITHEQLCKLACEWAYSIEEAWDTASQAFEAVGLTLVASPRATGETDIG